VYSAIKSHENKFSLSRIMRKKLKKSLISYNSSFRNEHGAFNSGKQELVKCLGMKNVQLIRAWCKNLPDKRRKRMLNNLVRKLVETNSTNQSCPWVHFVWSDLTQPISWLTQHNPLQVKKIGPNPTRPNTNCHWLTLSLYYSFWPVSGTCQIGQKN